MEHYLILARSVTYAQRMQKVLARAGVRSRIFRAPREVTELGCAYAVRVEHYEIQKAVRVIRGEGLPFVQIFVFRNGAYQEAAL